MGINQEIIVTAIYQDGVIKPLEPLNLADNELVQIHISRPAQPLSKGLAKYKGILAGQGDFNLAEIQEVSQRAINTKLEKLSNKLTGEV